MDAKTEVFKFIVDYWGKIPEKKKTIDTTLSDLGFFGDDKKEFMDAFFKTYNIDRSSFNNSKYIEAETNFLWTTLKSFFSKRNYADVCEINIAHLVNALTTKQWQD